MKYDIEKLKEEATPLGVAKYLGIKMIRKGKNVFIECPEHAERTGKVDGHINNCVLGDSFDFAYYCYACGAKGNLIRFVQTTQMCSFVEALEIIGDSCGGAEYFKAVSSYSQLNDASDCYWNGEEFVKKNNDVDYSYYTLTKEQYDLIGVKQNIYAKLVTEAFSEDAIGDDFDNSGVIKDINYECLIDGDVNSYPEVNYLITKNSNYSLKMLMREDIKSYCYIISNKAKETMAKYKELWDILNKNKGLSTVLHVDTEDVKQVCKQNFLQAKNIYLEFTDIKDISDEEREVLNDSFIYNYDNEMVIDEDNMF